ncbi:MAG: hypothetical protein OXE76_02755 [Alphaproteobacteria bacterium]|nr:hypothetical protein [Alphaproteobacteria bacterium]
MRLAAQLVDQAPGGEGRDLQVVDIDTLELSRPRTVGVEHVGLWAMERPASGASGVQRPAARTGECDRAAGSERASWLCERSALGELLGVDFERMNMMDLYRASGALLSRGDREASRRTCCPAR